jgi:hypothetical protein
MTTHTIAYAYPTSDQAVKMGKHGVYIEHAGKITPMPTYEAAIAHAATLGTLPDRWSMDHPANSTFLADAMRAQAHHNRQTL